jgi:hypothetical protein
VTPDQFHDADTLAGFAAPVGLRTVDTRPYVQREAARAVWRHRARQASWFVQGALYAAVAIAVGWGMYRLVMVSIELGHIVAATHG